MTEAWPEAEGAALEALLQESPHASSFRARRGAEGDLVVLKVPSRGEQAIETRRRLRHEATVRGVVDAAVVPRSLGWVATSWGSALCTEYVPAASLATSIPPRGMAVGAFLAAAVSVARAVERVHAAGVIHKDLSATNLLYAPATHRVWVIDFDCSSRLAEEDAGRAAGLGTLGYMAPEQTGRMALPLDARADLYTLGSLFYEMLTGRLPFTDADPLALLHATLARTPEAPSRVRPDAPPALDALVLKLLAKMPDARYQTAAALAVDLERCLAAWRAEGEVPAFTPGAGERRSALRMPSAPVGRDAEISSLRDALARTAAGARVSVAVSGPPGVGKTAVINAVERLAWGTGGAFAGGKCDQLQRDRPFAPLLEALRRLTRDALSWGESAMRAWRARQRGDLSPLGAVLPELRALVPTEAPPEVPLAEARSRLLDAIVNFLGMFSTPGRPLALFLDDVQWADPATLDFVARALAPDPDRAPMLLLLAVRDAEADARVTSLLAGPEVERIALGPLDAAATTDFVAAALDLPPDEAAPLAEAVHRQTGGNPFFLRLFLTALRDRGALRFEDGRWRWDLAAVAAQGVTENVSRILTERVVALPPDAVATLETAAALGARLDANSLAAACDCAPEALVDRLGPAAAAGLILPDGPAWLALSGGEAPATDDPLFRWPHDRVQQSIYERIDDARRDPFHLALARRLAGRFGAEAALFDVADHYRRAGAALADPEERARVAKLSLTAARRARAASAFDAAAAAARFGVGLTGAADQETALALHLTLADLCVVAADDAGVSASLAAARSLARTPAERVAVHEVQVRRHEARFDHRAAVDETARALAELGVELPTDPGTPRVLASIAATLWNTRLLEPEGILALPTCSDRDAATAMRLLTNVIDSAYFAKPEMFPLVYAELIRLTRAHGLSRDSALAFNGLAYLLSVVRDDPARGARIGEAAMRVLERFDARELVGKVAVVHWGFVMSRVRPVREGLPHYRNAYEVALAHGERIWGALAAGVWALMGFFHGPDLDEVAERLAWAAKEVVRLGSERDLLMVQLHRQVVANLRGEAPDAAVLAGEHLDPAAWLAKNRGGDEVNVADYEVLRAALALWFGRLDTALGALEAADGMVGKIPGSAHLALYHFVAGRARAAGARAGRGVRPLLLRKAKAHLAFLRRWERDCPENQRHRVRLVEAELAAAEGDLDGAVLRAEESARLARASGYVQDAAQALEAAAGFERDRGRERVAALYLTDARAAWAEWGAVAKVADLDARTAASGPSRASSPDLGRRTTTTGASLDAESIIRAARAISSEIRVEVLAARVVRALLEDTGARAAVLALARGDELHPACVATTEREGVRTEAPPDDSPLDGVAGVQRVAAALIRRCARSGEVITVADAAHDPALAAAGGEVTGSILVVPVEAAGARLGALYLENPMSAGAFGERRVEVARVLASQAAVSLRNAMLFADLDRALEHQKRLTAAYERFLPRQFVEQLGRAGILDVRLGDAVQRDISVLFADLVGFSSLAEAMGAAETFRFINAHLGRMEPAIFAYGGFVHQYLGDGIMAFFPRSADDAVQGGLAMLAGMRSVRADRAGMPGADARLGVGINSGPVLIGAIGGAGRMDRGVVGDTVNLASRVEGLTRLYGASLLVTGDTMERLTDPARYLTRLVDRVQVKGRVSVVAIHEVLDPEDATTERIVATGGDFRAAMARWDAGAFAEAKEGFEACAARCPDDGAARLFARRCEEHLRTPPPGVWTGVTTLTTK
ncbi:MAG: AAA family ATPase [Polyangiales bacterium]